MIASSHGACYEMSIVSDNVPLSAPSPPNPESSSHAELLDQLKTQVPEALFAMVSGRLNTYAQELEFSKLKIQVLEERLRLQRIEKYGPSSEKLSSLQLELLEQEPGVSREEVVAESERHAPPPASERKKRQHPGRQTLPADLPRVERVIACTPAQCVCGKCGHGNTVIGFEVSEVLAVEPARYFVLVTKREKRACKTCPEEGVVAAPLPDRIIDKSLVSDEVIIDTVVNKYCNHSPLYRQSVALLRDAGIDISRATMCGWVMTIGEMLMPLSTAMRNQLLAGTYIQADETPVDVQTHDGSGTNHQAYLWQYGTPGGMTVFEFQMSRKREGPLNFLGKFEGLLQTDGYAAYDRVGGPKMVHAACWSHSRRYFVDAVKLNKQDAASIRAVELINELFAIDAQARNENMDHAARHALRHEKAPPVLARILAHIEQMRKTVLPKSAAGKGCTYTLGIWERLIRFLDHPQLELSTNLAENSMRPIAVGRGNWIHIGSEHAGPRVAAIISVIESCRRLKIPVRDYLADILPGLANAPLHSFADRTPAAWAAKYPDTVRHALV
jgi:transposase